MKENKDDIYDLSIEKLDNAVLKYIIEYMPGYIYWKNTKSQYMGCNYNLALLSNLKKPSDIVGMRDKDFGWGAKEGDKFKADDQEVISTGSPKITEHTLPTKRPDGYYTVVRTEKVPLYDQFNQIIGVIGVAMDITDRKIMENQLKEEKIKAEEANEAKSYFLSCMSHDLRTPLNAIITSTQALLSFRSTQQQKLFLEGVLNSSKILHRLIEELLSFSKMETGKVELIQEPFDLLELIENVTSCLTETAAKKKLNLFVLYPNTLPKEFIGDPYQIHRILINLIENAIRYTENGYISISITGQIKQEQAKIQIDVKDTGIGIEKNRQKEIFDRFTRLSPSYQTNDHRIGLGLTIVKTLIAQMNGKISVQSNINEGSTFTCEIPLLVDEMIHTRKLQDICPPRLNMIIITDNSVLSHFLQNQINYPRLTIYSSKNIESTLKITVATKDPFILLVDDDLKHTTPLNIAKPFYENNTLSLTRFILLSKSLTLTERTTFKKYGFIKFLIKPIFPSELYRTIRDVCDSFCETGANHE